MCASQKSGISPDTIAFLSDLKQNNTREWFQTNKARYDAHVKEPAKQLAAELCNRLDEMTGRAHKPKIFRMNRDLRFSKDKTPYNTHVHLSWSPTKGGNTLAAWMLGISPDYSTVGCGVFEFSKGDLIAFRDRIAGADGAKLEKLVGQLAADGVRIDEPVLKRVPAGYDADGPWAEHLRRKGLMGWIDLGDVDQVKAATLEVRATEAFARLRGIYDFLNG